MSTGRAALVAVAVLLAACATAAAHVILDDVEQALA